MGRLLCLGIVSLALLGCSSSNDSSGDDTGTTLDCTEPADTLTDSDCEGTSLGRKLDCISSSEQNDAFAAGCAAENAGDPMDFDVCCPVDVRGVH